MVARMTEREIFRPQSQCPYHGTVCDPSQSDNHGAWSKHTDFIGQIVITGPYLVAGRFVLGGQALDGVGNPATLQHQAVIARHRAGQVTETMFIQCLVEQNSCVIPGKWPSRRIRPMVPRRESDDQDSWIGVTEWCNRAGVIVGVGIANLGQEADKAVATAAVCAESFRRLHKVPLRFDHVRLLILPSISANCRQETTPNLPSVTADKVSGQCNRGFEMGPKAREPVVGDRYINPDGQLFDVVAVDDVGETVELQYEDGAVEELDFDDWYSMQPKSVDASGGWDEPLDAFDDDSY